MTLPPLQTQEELVAGVGVGAACHEGSLSKPGHLALGPGSTSGGAGQLQTQAQKSLSHRPWDLIRSKSSGNSRPRAGGTNSHAYWGREPTGRAKPGVGCVTRRPNTQVKAQASEAWQESRLVVPVCISLLALP